MENLEVARTLSRLRGERSPYVIPSEMPALLPWLSAAIDGGDTWAMWVRGRIADSHLLPRDPELASSLWQRGWALGSAECAFELGHVAERARDRDAACALYEGAAADGIASAALRRGHLAVQRVSAEAWRLAGEETEALWDEAAWWYRRAIELGRCDAWADVASVLRCRPGATEETMVEVARLTALAADAPPADMLGRLFERIGGGDESNLSLAPFEESALVSWATAASETGDPWALWLHGRLAETGVAPGGSALALSLWQRGVERGDARCAFRLGFQLEKKKKKDACALYETAAAGGVGLAALRLGHLAKTWAETERWYRRATALGRPDAWLDLARCFAEGARGAPVDLVESVRCWERAAQGGGTGPLSVAVEIFDTGEYRGQKIGRDPVKARRFAEQGLDLGEGGGVPDCQYVMARLLAAGEGGPVDREGAALLSRLAGRRADAISEKARRLHTELWNTLDAAARSRVNQRDEALHPGETLDGID